MSSLGWNLGRAALWASLAAVALVRGPQHCIYEDSRHDIPSNLDESAFDSNLYHQLQAPYRDFACLPRHIHVSQASNVDEHNKVNMTISFTLEYRHCRDATPHVVYGHEWHPEQSASGEKTQFNFTSSLTGEYYKSNWIYHVTLPDLQAGSVQYWYRISVEPAVGANARTSRLLRRMSSPEETPALHFTTPPTPGSPTTIALIGDLGQTVNSTKTMSHIHKAAQKTSFNPHPYHLC
ncbi:hypothetical protein MHU86_14890 [Fragilaria crotonensis]|nr:hypothetical protein MHU86_14890 [Fragilaria crotonensis]